MASKSNKSKTAATDDTATATAEKKPRGPAPIITAISNAVPMPENLNNRGSASKYPFAELEIGMSFGLTNKSAANMLSIVSNQNRKTRPVKNPDGTVKMKPGAPITDANGAVIGTQPGTEPETERYKTFVAKDVDAATDPDGATVRVWRTK